MTPVHIEDLTFHAADGQRLAGRLYRGPRPQRGVLVSSGTGFPQGFYERFARYLAVQGAVVLTYDFRGIASSRPEDLTAVAIDYPDWGRLDMPAALDTLAAQAPGLPLAHVGHSVGGHFAGFMPNHARIDRHAFVAVGSGYWGHHHPTYNPLELFFWFGYGPWSLARHGYVKGGRLWRGADLPRGVFETWRRWCLNPRYFADELAGSLQPHAFAAISAPIRSWIFPDDPIATPRTGADMLALYPSAPSSLVVRAPADFGVRRIGHEGAFRRGLDLLWDEVWDWLDG